MQKIKKNFRPRLPSPAYHRPRHRGRHRNMLCSHVDQRLAFSGFGTRQTSQQRMDAFCRNSSLRPLPRSSDSRQRGRQQEPRLSGSDFRSRPFQEAFSRVDNGMADVE